MALGGLWNRLTGGIFGVGIGVAAADAMAPVIEPAKQKAWAENTNKVLSLGQLGELVAQALLEIGKAEAEAARTGYDPSRVAAVVQALLEAPGFGPALRMFRRETITREQLVHVLRKAKLEPQWDEALAELADERLEPAVIALAIVRGIIGDPGILPVAPPTGEGKVPKFPTFKVDAVKEAKAAGIDLERLSVMVANMGRPASPDQAARAEWRGRIEHVDYLRAIAEGDVRNEWAEAIFESFRAIPSPENFVEGRLRAWIDTAAMEAGAARHGMSAADAELLLKIHGRPLSWHQVFIGERRGGTYDGPQDVIDPAFLKALEESDIRPEWYAIAWAQRFNYPSPFVLRSITEAGDISGAEAETVLLYLGWEPTFAKKVAAKWAAKPAAAAKEETKTELASEYAGGYITEAEFRSALADLGYTGHVQDLLVSLNDARRVASWREKAVTAIGKKHIGAGFDAARAAADLAEVGVVGEAGTLLVDLWGRESVALTD